MWGGAFLEEVTCKPRPLPKHSFHTCLRATLTSMAAEDFLVHNGSDGQAVEAVGKGFPQFNVVAPLACQEGEAS